MLHSRGKVASVGFEVSGYESGNSHASAHPILKETPEFEINLEKGNLHDIQAVSHRESAKTTFVETEKKVRRRSR